MAIQVWDPFRELRQMEDNINRLWRGFNPAQQAGAEDWNVLIDVIKKPEEILVKASLPGMSPDDIELSVEDNVLTLRAERKAEESDQSGYLLRERPTGSFYRALRLPGDIDTERIHSSYEQGVLTVALPLAEEKKRKQIKINITSKELGPGKKS